MRISDWSSDVCSSDLHIHADLYKDSDYSGVLTDRSVTLGAHAAVGEDLSDRVLGGGALFGVIGRAQRTDIVHRVIIADVLQSIRYGCDHIVLPDRRHACLQTLPYRF